MQDPRPNPIPPRWSPNTVLFPSLSPKENGFILSLVEQKMKPYPDVPARFLEPHFAPFWEGDGCPPPAAVVLYLFSEAFAFMFDASTTLLRSSSRLAHAP